MSLKVWVSRNAVSMGSTKDDVIQRQGRDWKVVNVILEQTIGDSKALPVYRVFLSDQFQREGSAACSQAGPTSSVSIG